MDLSQASIVPLQMLNYNRIEVFIALYFTVAASCMLNDELWGNYLPQNWIIQCPSTPGNTLVLITRLLNLPLRYQLLLWQQLRSVYCHFLCKVLSVWWKTAWIYGDFKRVCELWRLKTELLHQTLEYSILIGQTRTVVLTLIGNSS